MDKYEIVGKMGRGKYSDVYRALRVGQDEKWSVLKILKPGTWRPTQFGWPKCEGKSKS